MASLFRRCVCQIGKLLGFTTSQQAAGSNTKANDAEQPVGTIVQTAATLSTVQLDQPRWASDELAPGDYFVRIQVLDPSGLKSRYSAARKLTVESAITTGDGTMLKSGDGKPVQSQR